jgi:hypothetical protein
VVIARYQCLTMYSFLIWFLALIAILKKAKHTIDEYCILNKNPIHALTNIVSSRPLFATFWTLRLLQVTFIQMVTKRGQMVHHPFLYILILVDGFIDDDDDDTPIASGSRIQQYTLWNALQNAKT